MFSFSRGNEGIMSYFFNIPLSNYAKANLKAHTFYISHETKPLVSGEKKKAFDFNILSSTLMLSLQGEDTHEATDDLARVIKRQQGMKNCLCCSGKILDNISVSPHLHSQKIRNKERI